VPQKPLHHFDVSGHLVQNTPRRVTESVKALLPGLSLDASLLQRWVEDLAPQVIGIKGTAVGSAENEMLITVPSRLQAVCCEQFS
jgi:hypothetical protein